MPYIDPKRREIIDRGGKPASIGELTYVFTKTAEEYRKTHGDRFNTFAMIMGAFLCAILEFYRRVIAPYEDNKIEENGDVYK